MVNLLYVSPILIFLILLVGLLIVLVGRLTRRKSNKIPVAAPCPTLLRGTVRKFQTEINGNLITWRFLLVRQDENHNEMTPIPVQIMSYKVDGIINEGDDVEISDTWVPPNTINTLSVFNYTNNSRVTAPDVMKLVKKFKSRAKIPFIIFIIIILIIFLFAWFSTHHY